MVCRNIRNLKYLTFTWGCQMNERDSEIIGGMLDEAGMVLAPSLEEAEVIILNTCCVREKAEQKVYAKVGELVRLKKDNPRLLLVICGCMVQQKGVPEHITQRFPEVDIILGTHNLYRLPELLEDSQNSRGILIEVLEEKPEGFSDAILPAKKGLKAKVNISFGCNNFCSYCIVPYVRGREVSRKPETILEEVRHLAASGCREILLLGQNVNSYGKDNVRYPDFSDLLLKVSQVDGIERIRFMTSHPKDFSEKLIQVIAGNKKLCKHIHLPVQAGSNKILEAMNRGYTREGYLKLVENIKDTIHGVSLTSDIIVGFPKETEKDFEETLNLIREAGFDSAYTFIYSPRRGTQAESLGDDVLREVKRERLKRLMELQNTISLELNRRMIGEKVEILAESRSKGKNGAMIHTGRTSTNKIVIVEDTGDRDLTGQLVEVEITAAQTWSLKGQLIS